MKPSSFSVPLKVHSITVGELQTNCYFIFEQSTKNCVIIDPGAEGEKIEQEIKKKGLNVVAIVNTHGHPDHISANGYLKKVFSCPIYIHQLDSVLLENSKNSVISE
ncbi:MAG: MBL fold metallo-hydrolase, partial [Endomicrobiia bacterium]